MRIPPTTVCAVKSAIVLRDLLEELRKTKFTGYCLVDVDATTRSLVFSEGVCLLAETPGAGGNEAFREVRGLSDRSVSASLHALSPPQVSVSVRFNEQCRVGKESEPKPAGRPLSTTVIKPIASRGQQGKVVQITSKTGSSTPPPAEPGHDDPHPSGLVGRKAPPDTPVERLSLDSIKCLKDSFRLDAASLLKELDLEHLMVEPGEPAHQKKPIGSPENEKC
jgi:hypothetical protein